MKTAAGYFVFLRWLNVSLRGLHLIAIIFIGAGMLGAPVAADLAALGAAITGFGMLALDIRSKPGHLKEVAGIMVLVKLLLLAWFALDASSRPALFWVIVAGSAIFAHAPAKFRHAVLIRR